jgi:hypothetical protein
MHLGLSGTQIARRMAANANADHLFCRHCVFGKR